MWAELLTPCLLDVTLSIIMLITSIAYIGYNHFVNGKCRYLSVLKKIPDDSESELLVSAGSKEMRFDFNRISKVFNRRVFVQHFSKTKWDQLVCISEFIILGLQFVNALMQLLNSDSDLPTITMLLVYLYLILLFTFRIMFSDITTVSRLRHITLFNVSVVIYHIILILRLLQLLVLLNVSTTKRSEEVTPLLRIIIFDMLLLVMVYLLRFQNSHNANYYEGDALPCLEPVSSLFLVLTFSWTNQLLKQATISPLIIIDMWGLLENDYAINVILRFKHYFNDLTPQLVVKLVKNSRQLFLRQLFLGIVSSIALFIPTVILKHFLDYVYDPYSVDSFDAWCMIFSIFLLKIAESLTSSFSLYLGKRVDIHLRTLLINEIYSKVLSKSITMQRSAGSIMNLMSADAYNIGTTVGYVITIPISCFMIILAICLLYGILGMSAFIGALLLIFLIPLNHQSASKIASFQKQVLKNTDTRISQMNELFNNIKSIKSFAWTGKFFEEIICTRDLELQNLKKKTIYTSLQSFLSSAAPTLVTFGAFLCYTIIEKKKLTTSVAFTSLTLFNMLRQPLIDLAAWCSDLYQAWISLQRIQSFLEDKETHKYNILDQSEFNKIGFENLSFSWGENCFTLSNLDILFNPGLTVIIGPTGSGKTSLLLALLGEMDIINKGRVYLPGRIPNELLQADPKSGLKKSVSYCSQTSWLINDTIKNNVLFTSAYEPKRYEAVLRACALDHDLKILSDETQIGESGVVLSGGQKQRLALARAVYSDSEYILLDDCLSAVDAHTASWLYDNCLTGELMKGRTCIFTSQNVSLTISKANWVVILENGKISDQGTVDDLVMDKTLTLKKVVSSVGDMKNPLTEVESTATRNNLIEDELKNEGSILLSTYKDYFKLIGGSTVWTLIILLYVVSQLLFISQTLWLRTWTLDNNKSHSGMYFIVIYLVIGGAYSLVSTFRVYYVSLKGLKASNSLFRSALSCILKAKSRFFDVTPIGRIINRFSKDIQSLDQELIRYTEVMLMYLTHCISTIIIICFVTPMFLLFAGLIISLYYLLGKRYLSLSRELKRLDSITRSPLFSQFQETLTGSITIRAYSQETKYLEQNILKLDQNNKAYYYLWLSNRWLTVRTDFIGALMVLVAGSFIILNVNNLDAGLAGLSLTYAMTFNSYAVWLIRAYVTMEMSMNSVERLEEYTHLENEAPSVLQTDDFIDKDWPQQGTLQVENLSLSYSEELDPVIHNVSFSVNPLEKIAIVGRTGAGKSTIISACFRFLEPDIGSRVLIDGINIEEIGLEKLRGSLSLIPQDPSLFQGTVRFNLDPFHEYDDELIWKSLVDVSLVSPTLISKEFINKKVQENGTNFSQGQKQLLCMARSLLKNSKIIFMDEATSSIDHETDNLLQQTIRKSFLQSTVITIAHRLNSIIDYDKVMVLDNGKLVEFDTPTSLLANQNSFFYKLCDKSGDLNQLRDKVE